MLWLAGMVFVERLAPALFLLREEYVGVIPWANFDGMHYVTIGTDGYHPYQQAFFPGYPLLIRAFSELFPNILAETIAIVISRILFLPALLVFYALARRVVPQQAVWAVVLLLLFPTSFFFGAAYTASLYLLLGAGVFLLLLHRQHLLAGIVGAAASGSWLFGAFLFPAALLAWKEEEEKKKNKGDKKDKKWVLAIFVMPLGLVGYMIYLWWSMGDPLAFIHVQPSFGAGRSGGEIILLPQVLWRYAKILLTASANTVQYFVAGFELLTLILALFLLWQGYLRKLPLAYLLYSMAIVITPTLTGTLSSFPRYFLAAFPLFWVLANISGRTKVVVALVFLLVQAVVSSAFLRGHFVS